MQRTIDLKALFRRALVVLALFVGLVVPSSAAALTFDVSSTADSGAGSLRQAIDDANATPGADVIDFVGGSEGTIALDSALPPISEAVTIDSGQTATVAGGSLTGTESGFQVAASDVQIASMVIQDFPGDGVEVTSGANAVVENSVITSNGGSGVSLGMGTTGATVLGNVISGNGNWGIDVAGGVSADRHLIRGNLVGTDAAGAAALPNASGGVLVEAGAPGTAVGGSGTGQGNVLSGNTGPGVRVSANGTSVVQNLIGVDATGASAIGNGASGIEVQGTPSGVVIGGTTVAAANVIAGNGIHGISLGATATQVIGNQIGTDRSGTSAIPNAQDGIFVAGANNRIGVSGTSGAGNPVANLISGNAAYGIEVGSGGNGTLIQANKIGTDASGSAALPNGVAPTGAGILAQEAVTIGGTAAGTGNLISGNDGPGVSLDGSDPGQSSTVLGNTIGLNGAGTGTVANSGAGISIAAGTDATVGGAATGAGNLISGNTGSGIASDGTGVQISGNRIGVAADGTTAAGNGGDGIALGAAAQGHLIGGTTAADENLVVNQTGSGISDLSAAGGNQIAANSIFANGTLPIDQLADGSLNANDAADAAPPQNSPTITSALTNGSRVTVRGALQSAASRTYVVRVYAAAAGTCDGTDMRSYVGSTTVQTNAAGSGSFNTTFAQGLPQNRCVTATAMSPQKNTSELGAGSATAVAGTVQVAPVSYSVLESDRKATITFRRTAPTTQSMTIHYATVAGTAHAGSDFTAKSAIATIPAGATSTNVVVPVVDDSPAEPREAFTVKIDSPVGAVLGTATTATVTIDDDAFGTATRVSLVVAKPLKATRAGVVKVGVRNMNLFAVTGTLRVMQGTRAIGSAAVSVAKGATQQLNVQLSPGAVAELKQKGQLKATLALLVRDGDAHQRIVSQPVTIFRG